MLDKYRCLRCSHVYDWSTVNSATHQRYMDCDIWRCPNCKAQQDSRSFQPFLGIGAQNVERVTDEHLEQERRSRFVEEMEQRGYYVDANYWSDRND